MWDFSCISQLDFQTQGAHVAWQRSRRTPKLKENIITTRRILSSASGFPQTRACFLVETKSDGWLKSASGGEKRCEDEENIFFIWWLIQVSVRMSVYAHKCHNTHIKTPMRSQWGKQLGIPYGWSQSQRLFPLSKSAPSSLNILCESASSSTDTPSPPHTGTRATCWWGSPKEPAPCSDRWGIWEAQTKLCVTWLEFQLGFKNSGFHCHTDDAIGAC